MNLRDYLLTVRRRWISAVVGALCVLALGSAVTLLVTPRYTSTIRLFFAVQGTESVTDLAQGSTFAEKQMTSYAQVTTSPLVLDPVIKELGLHTTAAALAKSVTATVPTETVILEVSVTRVSPDDSARIANAIGAELAKVASSLTPDQSNGSEAVKATVFAPAQIPSAPSSPNIPRNAAVTLVLALIVGVGVALLREMLDTRIRDDSHLRSITDLPVLGQIVFNDQVQTEPVIVSDDPASPAAEAVRRLRTNLQFIGAAHSSKTLVITSSIPEEGKSTTALNLAAALAQAGSRVLLIDADLRRPSIGEYLGLESDAGLTSVLIGRADVEDVVQRWGPDGLAVLTSGPVPPNPSELLGSSAMSDTLQKLSESYDVVLLDSSPLLAVTDATILTKFAGGALVVVGADRVHRAQLAEALENMETAGGTVFGIVLNKLARRDTKSYGYYSYTSHGSRKDRQITVPDWESQPPLDSEFAPLDSKFVEDGRDRAVAKAARAEG